MAEPIDPNRWKDTASSQWRRRCAEPAPRAADFGWAVSESRRPDSGVPVPLATMLGAGAELSDAEIAYVTAQVAQTLADLHESGRCHGAVGVAAVEVDALGQVVLRAACGSVPSMSAAEDIAGLAALFGELIRARPIPGSLAEVRVTLSRGSSSASQVNALLRPLAALSLMRLIDQSSRAAPHTQTSDDGIDAGESKPVTDAAARVSERAVGARRAGGSPGSSRSGSVPTGSSPPGLSPPVSRRARGVSSSDGGAAAENRGVVGWARQPVVLAIGVAVSCVFIWIMVGLSRGADIAVVAGSTNESGAASTEATGPTPSAASTAPTESGTPAAPSASTGPSALTSPASPAPGSGSVGDRGGGGGGGWVIDWTAALASLDERRLAAFTAADGGRLKAVDALGSAAMTNDLGTVAELRQRNVKPIGLQTSVESVRVLAQSPTTVTLEVSDHRSGYELIDRVTGVTVEKVAARGSQRWRVRLDHQDSGWLVTAVTHVQARGRAG